MRSFVIKILLLKESFTLRFTLAISSKVLPSIDCSKLAQIEFIFMTLKNNPWDQSVIMHLQSASQRGLLKKVPLEPEHVPPNEDF